VHRRAVGVFMLMTLATRSSRTSGITFSTATPVDTTQFLFPQRPGRLGSASSTGRQLDKHNIRDIIVVVIYGIPW